MIGNKKRYLCSSKKDVVVYVFIACLLFIYLLRLLGYRNVIYILHDEFAYWAIAAKYSGYDWKGMMIDSSYYSMGYSLLLVPLFYLGISASKMYKIAIVLNAVFVILSYFISLYLGKRLLKKLTNTEIVLVSGLINCLPFIVTQVNYAWTETLLYFLFWLETLCIYLFFESKRIKWACGALGVSIFMFFVHQRTIGVLITTIIMIAFFVMVQGIKQFNIKIYFIIPFFICFFAMILWFMFLKKYNLEQVFGDNQDKVAMNDFSGRISQVVSIFSFSGLGNVLYSFFGKFFYFGLSTFLIGPYVLILLIRDIVMNPRIKSWNQERFFNFFLILSFASMIAISAIATNGGWYSNDKVVARIDILFYGRYFEFIIGPLMLLGFGYIKEINGKLSIAFLTILFYLIVTIATSAITLKVESPFMVDLSAIALNYFYWNVSDYQGAVFHGAILCCGIFIITIFLMSMKIKIRFIICLCIILAMCTMETNVNDEFTKQKELQNEKYVYNTANYLRENMTNEMLSFVYSPEQNKFNKLAFYIQYNLYDKSIEKEEADNFGGFNVKDNTIYIVMNDSDLYQEFEQNCEALYSNGLVGLFRKLKGE